MIVGSTFVLLAFLYYYLLAGTSNSITPIYADVAVRILLLFIIIHYYFAKVIVIEKILQSKLLLT